jgi:hypothetical protein
MLLAEYNEDGSAMVRGWRCGFESGRQGGVDHSCSKRRTALTQQGITKVQMLHRLYLSYHRRVQIGETAGFKDKRPFTGRWPARNMAMRCPFIPRDGNNAAVLLHNLACSWNLWGKEEGGRRVPIEESMAAVGPLSETL